MSTITTTTDLRKPGAGGQPCLTLVPAVKGDVDETELVQLTLKVRAGSAVSAPTYKRKVAQWYTSTVDCGVGGFRRDFRSEQCGNRSGQGSRYSHHLAW